MASYKILAEYTAMMMNKCRTMDVSAVPYTHPGHLRFRNVYEAIEVVQSQAQELFDHVYRGQMRSLVVPKWEDAFGARAEKILLEGAETLSRADRETVETMASVWDITLFLEE